MRLVKHLSLYLVMTVAMIVVVAGCANPKKVKLVERNFLTPDIVFNEDWNKVGGYKQLLAPSRPIVWWEVDNYKHPTKNWYKSEHTHFNQKVYDVYMEYDDDDIFIRDWCVFKKKGVQFLFEFSDVRYEYLKNSSDRIIGVQILFYDKFDKIIEKTNVYIK